MDDSEWNPAISDFAQGVDIKAEGFESILLVVMIDEKIIFLLVEDVLYVPTAGCNRFSPGLAIDQRFQMKRDNDTNLFGMMKDGSGVIRTQYDKNL